MKKPASKRKHLSDWSAFDLQIGVPTSVTDHLLQAGEGWHADLLPATPPADLQDAHQPWLFASLWRRVLAIVRDPVHSRKVGKRRAVLVLDTALFLIQPDGTVEVELRVCTGLGSNESERVSPWTVAGLAMPWKNIWLQNLLRSAVPEVELATRRAGGSVSTQLAKAYCAWAAEVFGRELRRSADLREMRRRIAVGVALDPVALRLGARLPKTMMAANIVLLGPYNHVLRHRQAIDALQGETPALLPLFGAVCDEFGFPADGEPVQRLKRYLLGEGLSERLWRLLAHADGRLLLPLRTYYCGDLARVSTEHLRLLDRLQLRRQPPAWFIDALLRPWGAPDNRAWTYVDQLDGNLTLWRLVARTVPMPPVADAQLLADFDLVHRWIMACGHGLQPDGCQRRAGWRWLLKMATHWAAGCRARLELEGRSWPVPTEGLVDGAYELVPLASELDLWEEGQAMRHCADRMARDCLAVSTFMASIRRAGKRAATVRYLLQDGAWGVDEIKGFGNQAVGGPEVDAAAAFAARLVVSEGAAGDMTDEPSDDEDADVPIDDDDATDDEAASEVEGENEDVEDEDEAEGANARLIDQVVAAALDAHAPESQGSLDGRLSAWLDHHHGEGNLSYSHGGPILFEHQFDDWESDVEPWLERLHDDGRISDRRWAKLRKVPDLLKALSAAERRMIATEFVESILGDQNVDADSYAHWGAEQITASDGRSVYLVYTVTGYSFTSVEVTLHGVCATLAEVAEFLSGLGRFSGLPLQAQTVDQPT